MHFNQTKYLPVQYKTPCRSETLKQVNNIVLRSNKVNFKAYTKDEIIELRTLSTSYPSDLATFLGFEINQMAYRLVTSFKMMSILKHIGIGRY